MDQLNEVIKERILENKNLFTKEEYKNINENMRLTKKIYLIGLVNGKNIYESKTE